MMGEDYDKSKLQKQKTKIYKKRNGQSDKIMIKEKKKGENHSLAMEAKIEDREKKEKVYKEKICLEERC